MLDLRFRNLAIGLAVGAGIGAGGAYAYFSRLQPAPRLQLAPLPPGVRPGDEASVFRPDHPALKFGLPQTDVMRFYEGFVASFDHRTRNPKWVLEFVSRDTLRGEGSREQSLFFEDTGIEPRFRAKLDDYRDSGYDRGHMAPAANHRSSQKAMDDTFSLSNISPQVGPGFNRDYWARFEKFVKDAAKVSDGVFIVTGPLWLPQPDEAGRGRWEMRHPMIGQPPQLVSVPTHYFKVVLAENSSGRHGQHSAAVGAFVMPNAAIDPQTPVTAFTVPLEALESVAGAKFFPGFLNERRRTALDDAALGWQAEGKHRLQGLDRMSITQDQAALLPSQAADPASVGSLPAAAPAKRGRGRPRKDAQQQQQPGAAGEPPPLAVSSGLVNRQAKTVNGQGAVHLCDLMACQLPPERWWEAGGGGNGGGSQHRGNGRGGPQRQGSGGRGGRPRAALQEPAALAEANASSSSSSSSQVGALDNSSSSTPLARARL